jgi:hypothetical protein
MKLGYIKILAISICLSGTISCAAARTQNDNSAANNSTVESAAPQEGGASGKTDLDKAIRKTDFKNGFTYEPFCAGEETTKVTVKDGEYSKETKDKDSDYVDHFYFNVLDVAYGDVDNDNKEDAIVITSCNTGGTGQFSEGFIYTLKNGKPTLLDRIAGGDRAEGGLRGAKMENGLLVVERNGAGEGGGLCCPEFLVTTKYKWNGKALAQSGAETQKPLYPEERVNFAKGTAKTTIKGTVEEIKRYVLGARKGQTLIVSVNTDKVTVGLSKGDADVTDGTNSFSAKLNENGDFAVQVQNLGDKPMEFTLTIEIR